MLRSILLLLAFIPGLAIAQWNYPQTAKDQTTDEYFGTRVADPYRWLEDDRSEATKNWVTAQNKITFNYLENIPWRTAWLNRIEELNNYPTIFSPFTRGEYIYYYKNNGLQNQAVLYRTKGLEGKPELVIDPNNFSADGTTGMASFSLSNNGRYGVVSKSMGGSDWRIFRVMDMNTLQYLPDSLSWIKFSNATWLGNGFYYNRFAQPGQGKELTAKNEFPKIYYHKLGTPQNEDVLVYEDKTNGARSFGLSVTEDEQHMILSLTERAKGKNGNGIWYAHAQDKKLKAIIAEPGEYSYSFVDEHQGRLLFLTNDHAPNFKLIAIDPANPGPEYWTTIIPEKEEPMTTVNTGGGKLFVMYNKDVLTHAYVYNYEGKLEREVTPPALGNVTGFNGRDNAPFVFYSLYSMLTPSVIYRYDIASGKSTVYQKPEVKFNTDDFVMEQKFYTSKDGTKVPAFICYKKGLKKDGKNPTILYGYGGFSIISYPTFSATRIAWLEQGGVFCIANLRGGNEYGEKWHQAGMLDKKQNVFDDFIAAAEFLAKEKYTSKDYLALQGGSNGGLLVGAVINQRPDICRVAIPQVGVMDMLRYHKFTIGSAWVNEYGSSDKESDFNNIYKFSPLHNIQEGKKYPAVLVTTADHDDRVVPGHSFKYTATLQEKYKGPNPVFIRVDVNSGHGASNTQKAMETTADIYSFIFSNMKLKPKF